MTDLRFPKRIGNKYEGRPDCHNGGEAAMMRVCEQGTLGCGIRHERDAEKLIQENHKLRMMLFSQHGNSEHYLYGDDGVRHCNTCHIDFNWDSPEEMETKLSNWYNRQLAKLQAQKKQQEITP